MRGDLGPFFNVTETDEGKQLSWRYNHTYNLYYFHIINSDPSDETQGKGQGVVISTYLSRS